MMDDAKAKKLANAKKQLNKFKKKKQKQEQSDGEDISEPLTSDNVSQASSDAVASDLESVSSEYEGQETVLDGRPVSELLNRLAELEELVAGKEAAMTSLSDENTELRSQLEGVGIQNSSSQLVPNHDSDWEKELTEYRTQNHQLQHYVQHYQESLKERDGEILTLRDHIRQIQNSTPVDQSAEYETLHLQISGLKEQLEHANHALARQSAPSPQPIVDAKYEIISLQQQLAESQQMIESYKHGLAERDKALQQLAAAVAQREQELSQLKSDTALKDEQMQGLAQKISKKSEEISELQEELELNSARHNEDKRIIEDLRRARSPDDDTDSIASAQGSVSEEEVELRLSEKEEQFGQNMMLIKESMAQRQQELQTEIESVKGQLAEWQAYGQSAQVQLTQVTQHYEARLAQAIQQYAVDNVQRAADGSSAPHVQDEINRLKAEHEEQMKVLVDTAEEEANSLRERITELEALEQRPSAPEGDNSATLVPTDPMEDELNTYRELLEDKEKQVNELEGLLEQSTSKLQDQSQQAADLVRQNETLNTELTQSHSEADNLNSELQRLQELCANLETAQKSSQNEHSTLTADLVDSQEKLSKLRHEHSELHNDYSALAERLSEEKSHLESQLNTVQLDLKHTQVESTELKDQDAKNKALLKELTDSNGAKLAENDELKTSINDLTKELDHSKDTISRLEEKKQSSEEDLAKLQKQVSQLEEERVHLQQDKQALQAECDNYSTKQNEMQADSETSFQRSEQPVEPLVEETLYTRQEAVLEYETPETIDDDYMAESTSIESTRGHEEQPDPLHELSEELCLKSAALETQSEVLKQLESRLNEVTQERKDLQVKTEKLIDETKAMEKDVREKQDKYTNNLQLLRDKLITTEKDLKSKSDELARREQITSEAEKMVANEKVRATQAEHRSSEAEERLSKAEHVALEATEKAKAELASANEKINDAAERQSEMEEKTLLLSNRLTELESKLSAAQDDIRVLEQTNSDLLDQNGKLQDTNESLLSEKEQLTSQLSEKDDLADEVAKLTDDFKSAVESREKLEREICELQEQAAEYQAKLEEAAEHQAKLKEAAEYQVKLEEAAEFQAKLEEAARNQLTEMADRSVVIESLQSESAELKSQLDQAQTEKDLREEKFAKEREHMTKEVEQHKANAEQKLQELVSMTNQSRQDHNLQVSLLNDEVELRNRELEVIKSENQSLLHEKQALRAQLDATGSDDKDALIETLQTSLSAYRVQIEHLQSESAERDAEHEKEVEKYNQDGNRSAQQIAHLGAQVEELQKHHEQLQAYIATIKSQAEDYRQALEQAIANQQAVQTEYTRLKTESEKIRDESDKWKMDTEQLKSDAELLRSEAEERNILTEQLRAELNQLSNEAEGLRHRKTLLEEEAESNKLERDRVQSEYDTYKHAVNTQTLESSQSAKQELQHITQQLQSKLDEVTDQKHGVELELDDAKQLLGEIQTELSTVQTDKEQIENEKEDLSNQLNSVIKDLREELSQSEASAETLSEQLSQSESTIKELQKELSHSNDTIKALRDELLQSNDSVQGLREEQFQTKAFIEDLQQKISQSDTLVEDLRNSQSQSNYAIEGLRNDLSESEASVASLQEKISLSEATLNDLQGKLLLSDKTIEGLREQLAQSDAAVQNLQEEQPQSEITKLEDELSQSHTVNEQLQNELVTIRAKLGSFEPLPGKLTAAEEKVRELEAAKQTDEKDITVLREGLHAAQAAVSDAERRCQEYSEEKQEMERLVDQLNSAPSGMADLTQLTANFDEERAMLNFQIKDLEAKLDDLREELDEHQRGIKGVATDSYQDDINHAVATALREQKISLMSDRQVEMDGLAAQVKQQLEKERAQLEADTQRRFMAEFQNAKRELKTEHQQQVDELKQAYGKDSTADREMLYAEIEEKKEALTRIQRQLTLTEQENRKLNEETMALEQVRLEKQQLQAQLDKVHGELEDTVTASSPVVNQEALLSANPVLSTGVEDSSQYQCLHEENRRLGDENGELRDLIEQLKQSDYAKLRLAYDQLRQQNEALRQQLAETPTSYDFLSSPAPAAHREDITARLDAMRCQLEALTQTYATMGEAINRGPNSSPMVGETTPSVVEAAISRLESRLREREQAAVADQQAARRREAELEAARQAAREQNDRAAAEIERAREYHAAEIQKTKSACQAASLAEVRKTRLEVEEEYSAAIARLRRELADDAEAKEREMSERHRKQLEEMEQEMRVREDRLNAEIEELKQQNLLLAEESTKMVKELESSLSALRAEKSAPQDSPAVSSLDGTNFADIEQNQAHVCMSSPVDVEQIELIKAEPSDLQAAGVSELPTNAFFPPLIEQIQEKLLALEDENMLLKENVEMKSLTISELDDHVQNLQDNLGELSDQMASLNREKQQLLQEMEGITSQLLATRKTLTEAHDVDMSELQSELLQLKTFHVEQLRIIKDLNESVTARAVESAKEEALLQITAAELTNNAIINSLEEEIKRRDLTLQTGSDRAAAGALDDPRQEADDLSEPIDHTDEELESLSAERDSLITERDAVKRELLGAAADNSALRAEIESLSAERQFLVGLQNESQLALEEITSQKEAAVLLAENAQTDAAKRVEFANRERDDAKKGLLETAADNSALHAEIETLSAERQFLVALQNESQVTLEEITSQKEAAVLLAENAQTDAAKHVELANLERDIAAQNLQDLQAQYADLEENLNALTAENIELTKDRQVFTTSMALVQEDQDNLHHASKEAMEGLRRKHTVELDIHLDQKDRQVFVTGMAQVQEDQDNLHQASKEAMEGLKRKYTVELDFHRDQVERLVAENKAQSNMINELEDDLRNKNSMISTLEGDRQRILEINSRLIAKLSEVIGQTHQMTKLFDDSRRGSRPNSRPNSRPPSRLGVDGGAANNLDKSMVSLPDEGLEVSQYIIDGEFFLGPELTQVDEDFISATLLALTDNIQRVVLRCDQQSEQLAVSPQAAALMDVTMRTDDQQTQETEPVTPGVAPDVVPVGVVIHEMAPEISAFQPSSTSDVTSGQEDGEVESTAANSSEAASIDATDEQLLYLQKELEAVKKQRQVQLANSKPSNNPEVLNQLTMLIHETERRLLDLFHLQQDIQREQRMSDDNGSEDSTQPSPAARTQTDLTSYITQKLNRRTAETPTVSTAEDVSRPSPKPESDGERPLSPSDLSVCQDEMDQRDIQIRDQRQQIEALELEISNILSTSLSQRSMLSRDVTQYNEIAPYHHSQREGSHLPRMEEALNTIQTLTQTCQVQEAQVAQLNKEAEELQLQMARLDDTRQTEISDLKARIESQKLRDSSLPSRETIQRLRDAASDLEEQVDQKDSELQELQSLFQAQELNSKKLRGELNNELESVQIQLRDLAGQQEALASRNDDLEAELKKLQSSEQVYKSLVRDRDGEIQLLASAVEKLRTDKEALEAELCAALPDTDNKLVDALQAERAILEQKLAAAEVKCQQEADAKAEAEMKQEQVLSEKERIQSEVEKMEKALNSERLTANAAISEASETRAELDSLQIELNSVKHELAATTDAIKIQRQHLDGLSKQDERLEDLESHLESTKAEAETAKSELNEARQELTELNLLLETAKEQHGATEDELQLARDEVAAAQVEHEALKEELASSKSTVERLLALDSQEADVEVQYKELLDQKTQEVELYKCAMSRLEDEITTSVEENEQLKTASEVRKSEVESLQKFSEDLQADFDQVQALVEKRDRELQELTEAYESLENKNAELMSTQAAIELKISEMEAATSLANNSIQEQDEELYENVQKLEEQLDKEIKAHQETLQKYQRELDKLEEKHQQQVTDLTAAHESHIERLRQEVEGFLNDEPIVERTINEVLSQAELDMSDAGSFNHSMKNAIEDYLLNQANKRQMNGHQVDRIEGQTERVLSLSKKHSTDEYNGQRAIIQGLKDLLAVVDTSRAQAAVERESADWRMTLVRAVYAVFTKERELYMAQLREALASGRIEASEARVLENKAENLARQQNSAIDLLLSTDRQSLLEEIGSLKIEKEHLAQRTDALSAEARQREANLAEHSDLLSYKLKQQDSLLDNQSHDLVAVREKCRLQMSDIEELQAKVHDTSMRAANLEAERDLAKELIKARDMKIDQLERFSSDDKESIAQLDCQLKLTKQRESDLRNELEQETRRRDLDRESADLQQRTLKQSIDELKEKLRQSGVEREKNLYKFEKEKTDLEKELADNAAEINSLRERVETLTRDNAAEKSQRNEILKQLGAERCLTDELRRKVVEAERRPPEEVHQAVVEDLDAEKSRVIDLTAALDRAKNRTANLSTALDMERAQGLERLEKERSTSGTLKRDLLAREAELADQDRALNSETSKVAALRSEIARLSDELSSVRRTMTDVSHRLNAEQHDKTGERQARLSFEAECETARRKISDMEATIAEKEKVIVSQHRDLVRLRSSVSSRGLDDTFQSARSSPLLSADSPPAHLQLAALTERLQSVAGRLNDCSETTHQDVSDIVRQLSMLNRNLALHPERAASPYHLPTSPHRPPASQSYLDSTPQRLLQLIDQLSQEKSELRRTLINLEGEIQAYRTREDESSANRPLSSYWNSVITDLYSRLRRAESRVRGLIYQKRVLLKQLGGFEETEAEVLGRLATLGAIRDSEPYKISPRRRFRAAVRTVIAIQRARWLVRRSTRLNKEGAADIIRRRSRTVQSRPKTAARTRVPLTPLPNNTSPLPNNTSPQAKGTESLSSYMQQITPPSRPQSAPEANGVTFNGIHDDSASQHIDRLERLQERLSKMNQAEFS